MLGVFLQAAGLGGGGFNFVNLLQYLQNYGFFAYILPFLLVFAVVFAIATQLDIFKKNKGAAVIVALSVGLLSLVGGFVPTFFSTIFPRFGVGLSIMLVALLLAGIFLATGDDKKKNVYTWVFFGLAGLVFLFVLFSSLGDWQFSGTGNWQYWWDNYAGIVLFILALVGVIVAVTASNEKAG